MGGGRVGGKRKHVTIMFTLFVLEYFQLDFNLVEYLSFIAVKTLFT